jgi:alanine dehydrogenase
MTSVNQADFPYFVSAEATRRAFDWHSAIDSLRSAYSDATDPAATPPRTVARGDGVWLRSLTAVLPAGKYMGGKLFGVGRNGGVSYLIVLFDQATGAVVGLIDGKLVTAFRTAATSAVAVDRLTSSDPVRLGLLGSGLEARHHVEAIAAVRPVLSITVFSPTIQNCQLFAEKITEQLDIPCRAAASPREAVADANVVVAAARSRDETPILHGAWLNEPATLVSIGSTLPEQREISPDVIDRCDLLICDAVDEVVGETGDMIEARTAGVAYEHKLISLAHALSGEMEARIRKARLPLYKSVGSGLQDVAVAGLLFDRAISRGWAAPLPIEFAKKRM